jgi:predicted RNA methylase
VQVTFGGHIGDSDKVQKLTEVIMKIQNSILNILDKCTVEGNTVFLTCGQLDRKSYEDVNKCLENIGGKWNRKAKGHVFESDPVELLDNLILTGETINLKKQYQFFPTPREIGDLMCKMAEINRYCRVLEPSAGNGQLVDAILASDPESVYMVELNPAMCNELNRRTSNLRPVVILDESDFLSKGLPEKIQVDRVVMNPPFSKQQDIDHIYEAFKCLVSGGILVSVVSESPFFRENKKSVAFREWLDENGAEIIDNDPGAFKDSGTMVKTRIIKVRK